jgi:drug/metabolite transporter (DMT)-like permease
VASVDALAAWLWRSPYLLLSIAAFFWASNSVVGRAVRDVIPPATLSFWRWLVAAAVMAAVAGPRLAAQRAALRAEWRRLALLGGLGVAGFSMLLYFGLHRTTAVNGLLVQAVQPCLTMVAMAALVGERPSGRMVAGLVVSLVGVVVIVARGSLGTLLALSANPGDLLIFAATLVYSVYTILVSRLALRDPIVAAAAIFIAGTVWLVPAYAVELIDGQRMAVTPATVAVILYTALFASCLAYIAYNRTVALIGPTRAGSVTNLMPVFGTLLATLLLDERLHGYHLVGIVLVVAGVVLVRARSAAAGEAPASFADLAPAALARRLFLAGIERVAGNHRVDRLADERALAGGRPAAAAGLKREAQAPAVMVAAGDAGEPSGVEAAAQPSGLVAEAQRHAHGRRIAGREAVFQCGGESPGGDQRAVLITHQAALRRHRSRGLWRCRGL